MPCPVSRSAPTPCNAYQHEPCATLTPHFTHHLPRDACSSRTPDDKENSQHCLYATLPRVHVVEPSEKTHVRPVQQPCLQLLEAIRGEIAYEALSHIYLEQLF